MQKHILLAVVSACSLAMAHWGWTTFGPISPVETIDYGSRPPIDDRFRVVAVTDAAIFPHRVSRRAVLSFCSDYEESVRAITIYSLPPEEIDDWTGVLIVFGRTDWLFPKIDRFSGTVYVIFPSDPPPVLDVRAPIRVLLRKSEPNDPNSDEWKKWAAANRVPIIQGGPEDANGIAGGFRQLTERSHDAEYNTMLLIKDTFENAKMIVQAALQEIYGTENVGYRPFDFGEGGSFKITIPTNKRRTQIVGLVPGVVQADNPRLEGVMVGLFGCRILEEPLNAESRFLRIVFGREPDEPVRVRTGYRLRDEKLCYVR